MTEKISPENSMFVRGTYYTTNNKEIYTCLGPGQVHYVFSHKNLLFWISVDPNISKNFFNEYLNFVVK